MAQGIIRTSGFSNNLTRDFYKIMMNEYTRFAPMYPRVANELTWNEHQIKKGDMSTFGPFEQRTENGNIPYHLPLQGNNKEVTFTVYSMGFQISDEAMADDLTKNFSRLPAELGKAAAYTKELVFWDVLNSGFSTTRTSLDGQALFSNSHATLDSSSTQDNLGTAASLSETTLDEGILHYRKLKDENYIPIVKFPSLLIIPPEDERIAEELLNSPGRPYTSDNEPNFLAGQRIQYMVVPYLTSATAYFLLSTKAEHDLEFIMRQPLDFRSGDDMDTRSKKYNASMRLAADFWEWRGCFGNAGA